MFLSRLLHFPSTVILHSARFTQNPVSVGKPQNYSFLQRDFSPGVVICCAYHLPLRIKEAFNANAEIKAHSFDGKEVRDNKNCIRNSEQSTYLVQRE